MIKFKDELRNEVFLRLKDIWPVQESDLEMTNPPRQELGDLCFTFPFKLAKQKKANPRQTAQSILPYLSGLRGVKDIQIAAPGYINLFLDRNLVFRELFGSLNVPGLVPEEAKIIVEHTNINPNKAAHIGHLRNACLGDTLCRCLIYKGERVEIQNYIDDTGVQVVDVVYGLMELEGKTLADLEKFSGKFDYYCWDLYARVSSYLAGHPEVQPRKAEILKKIEHGASPEVDLARFVSRRILSAHLATMRRLGVGYDVLPCESSILGLRFWERAFALLKEKEGIYLATEGPQAGCWVMRLEDDEEKEKVIVRSDGTVTYVGKDIAYQLWKFGLLDKDFYYEPFLEEENKIVWISTSKPTPHRADFGKATKVFNVIDTRQSYLQKVVVQGLRALKFFAQAEKSIHFSYEMVALSQKSLKELNFEVGEADRERSFLEVSGRKGLGVKADDLLDRLEDKALAEVAKRNPGLASGPLREIARQIAAGAIRYFMLKFARNSLIVFDFDDALNFEGETGPYLQYTLVRLNSIFRKLEEREGFQEADAVQILGREAPDIDLLPEVEKRDFWDLVLYAGQFEEHVLQSINSLEFSHLAKFAFNLCQKTNAYYHRYVILGEADPGRRNTRILTVFLIRSILSKALSLMGIPPPERM